VNPPPPDRALIIKPSSLGDVVTALPVLHGLRRTFPAAHIAWLVTPGCSGVLAGQRGLDEAILFDRRRFGRIGRAGAPTRAFVDFCRDLHHRRFDWVIDLQGLFRSGFLALVTGAAVRAGFAKARELAPLFYTHTVDPAAEHTVDRNIELVRALGVDARGEDLVLTVTPDARASVNSALAEAGIDQAGYFLLVPGTRWTSKLYPLRRWREVAASLARERPVVLAGSPDERALCAQVAAAAAGVVNLAGRTALPELVALVASAACVVCCDSAASFIAPAVGTPFVTLIGPTRPERTGPYGPGGMAIRAEVPCMGCLKRTCGHVTCMQMIPPSSVVHAARQMAASGARMAR